MPRMIDLIRASAVPANLVQSAARGGLALPPQEMLEILVYLATASQPFGEQARLTLAGWDEASCRAAAANPQSPEAVLSYFSDRENFRPALFEALLANPSVDEECLGALAASLSREMADTVLNNDRVIHSRKILSALASNPNLNGIQCGRIEERLALLTDKQVEATIPEATKAEAGVSSQQSEPDREPAMELSQEDKEADEEVAKYISAHAAEIAADGDKPFQPVGGIESLPATASEAGELDISAKDAETHATSTEAGSHNGSGAGVAAAAAVVKKMAPAAVESQKRGSALQRISVLDVRGRIQLAMKGSKEERALLVRDGTKIVALAVLDSPKISDSEVEKFASQKNVLEAVLRAIPLKRRYMKVYNIVRNLVFNPRTPIDVSLGLMKNIMVADLKILSGNKEVSDTVRKLALRMYKQKLVVDK
jgi:hypothetical protein